MFLIKDFNPQIMTRLYSTRDYLKNSFLSTGINESLEKGFLGFSGPEPTNYVHSVGIIGNRLLLGVDPRLTLTQFNQISAQLTRLLISRTGITSSNMTIQKKLFSRAQYSGSSNQLTLKTGSKVGHAYVINQWSYGTLGGFILKKDANSSFIISNNHVIASSNQGKIGDALYHIDQFDQPHVVGKLHSYVTLSFTGFNELDLAIGKLQGFPLPSFNSAKVREPRFGERVYKYGATTGLTYGTIISKDYSAKVNYDNNNVHFENQLLIAGENGKAFSAGGDSGSIIRSAQNGDFLGLLFAGGGQSTIANYFTNVDKYIKKMI
jgi:S1-C subfamily serine protease